MKNLFIILFVLVSVICNAQSIHSGLKPLPDLVVNGYAKVHKGYKNNTKSGVITPCEFTVFSDRIVCACGSSTIDFYRIFDGKAYKTDKGKILEFEDTAKYIVLLYSKDTIYILEK